MMVLESVQICVGLFSPTDPGLCEPLEVICEVLKVQGYSFVWIDGVDRESPVLLPLEFFQAYRKLGTLQEVLAQLDASAAEALIEQGAEQSATVLARAASIMQREGLDARQALLTSIQWGITLKEIDGADQAALVTFATANHSQD